MAITVFVVQRFFKVVTRRRSLDQSWVGSQEVIIRNEPETNHKDQKTKAGYRIADYTATTTTIR
jgi:hypothetical protein